MKQLNLDFLDRELYLCPKRKVNAEIARLTNSSIIEPVEFSDWAAPIVLVVKTNGSIPICGDYKVAGNQAAKLDKYSLPWIGDIFASLEGGNIFSKLDLAHAYQQVALDEATKKFTTINTSKGFYQYIRLPFGVSSAPVIFQRMMESLLQGILNVSVYLDDILIAEKMEQAHLTILVKILSRLQNAGIRLKGSKCAFMLSSIDYLGQRISADRLQPPKEKVRAISEAPVSQNVT